MKNSSKRVRAPRRSSRRSAARRAGPPYFTEFLPDPSDQVPNSVLDAVEPEVGALAPPPSAPAMPGVPGGVSAGGEDVDGAIANGVSAGGEDVNGADANGASVNGAPSSGKKAGGSMSASERTLSGVRWTTISMLFNQILTLGRSVALAHLLSREDFGLMGMAATAQSAFSLFTNFGLQNTIISGKFADEKELHRQLNTIFTAEMIRAGLLSLMMMAAAVPTAKFYGDERLLPILLVLCLTPLVSACKNIGLTLLSRDVKFRSNTIYNVISSTITVAAPVALALWRRDVWALVWGQLIASAIGVAISYFYHPYRPRFQLDPAALRRSVKFGKWFLVISGMVYLTTTADNVFVGKLLGPATLGGYLVAYSIANLPATLVSKVLSSVLFPIFAKLGRDETDRLRAAVGRVLLVGSSLLIIITVPMMLLSPELISTFYGSKWADTADPLRVLMLVGLFRGMIQLISPLVMGLDRPDLEARSKIVEAIVFLAILYPMIQAFGTMGAAWAGVLIYFLSFVMRYRYASQLVPGGFTSMPRIVVTGALASAGGAALGALALHFLAPAPAPVRLFVAGGLTFVGCAALLMRLRPELRGELDKFGLTKMLNRFSRPKPKRA